MASASTPPDRSPSLTSLPVEILFIIILWVDTGSLFNLAQTCQLLRSILLPEYLDRNGISHPSSDDMRIFTALEHSTLPILGVLYPLHVLDTFTFDCSSHPGQSTRGQLDAARLFICRTAYIRTFNMHISTVTHADTAVSVAQFLLSFNGLLGTLDGKLHHRLWIDAPSDALQHAKLPSSHSGLNDRCGRYRRFESVET